MANEYTTAEFVKDTLQYTVDFSLYTDPVINTYIETASRMIDDYTQRVFYEYTGTEEYEVNWTQEGNIIVRPKYFPIITLTSLKLRWEPTITPIDLDLQYVEVFKEEGYLRYVGNSLSLVPPLRRSPIQRMRAIVEYTGGFATIPPQIVMATALIVGNMLKANNDIQGGSQETLKEKWGASDYSVEYSSSSSDTVATSSYFTPNVTTMLDTFCRQSVI